MSTTKTDEVFDSWEEMDEVELNSKLDKLKRETLKPTTAIVTSPPQQINGKAGRMMMTNQDDDYRPQYVPAEPTVKILKRPTHERDNKANLEIKPKAPVKTLQQREQEYAQARLRILGSATNSEEVVEAQFLQSLESLKGASLMNGSGGGASATNGFESTIQLQKPQDGIIRLPRGPDGTTGFMIKR